MPSARYYLVSYDISDDKRYREVHKTMKGYGRRLHYSVFGCEITPKQKIELEQELSEHINHDEDRIMMLDLGDLDRNPEEVVTFLGKNPDLTEDDTIVV